MSPDAAPRRLLARYGPLAALVVAGVFALVAFLVRSDAESTLDRVRTMIAIDERSEEIADAADAVEMAVTELAVAEEAGPALAGFATSYRELLAVGLESLDQRIAAGREIVAIRTQEIDAGSAGDHQAFNDLQGRYREQAAAWDGAGAGYADLLGMLPPISYDDLVGQLPDGAPTSTPLTPAADAVLAPPTGPAVVTGTLPGVIPCDPWDSGCVWDYEITWTETNMLGAEIQQIGMFYIDSAGSMWTGWGEGRTEPIEIDPGGTATYSSWLRNVVDTQSGTLIVTWSGVDAEGNPFSGEVRAALQPRAEVG